MRRLPLPAALALFAAAAWGQPGIQLPRLHVADDEATAVAVSPEGGTLVSPDGEPLFLRGMWGGDRIPGAATTVWEASPEVCQSWLIHLRSRGFNCIGVGAWPDEEALEPALELLTDFRIWLLVDAPSPRRVPRRMAEDLMEPIDWARFRDAVPPLVTLDAVTAEAIARAVIQPMSGLMLASPERFEGEANTLLLAVALWTSMVPWPEITGGIESAAPLGEAGRMRTDAERRHALVHLQPAQGERTLHLEGLPREPLLADLFSLATMRRRRQAIEGPVAKMPLGPHDRDDHALLLITPLPEDWALPDSSLAEP